MPLEQGVGRVVSVPLPSPVLAIEIALPPAGLSPNSARGSARLAKARAVKAYRKQAALAFLVARKRAGVGGLEAASVRATFYLPDNRRRDPDNLAASLKAVWDGARDAKLIADDNRLTHLPILIEVDARRPRLRVEIFDVEVRFDVEGVAGLRTAKRGGGNP